MLVMRKIAVIASREYQAAVRTKTFVIGLLMMPVMMLASIVLQWLFRDLVDTEDKRFAVVDNSGRSELVQLLVQKVDEYNQTKIFDAAGKQVKPRYVVETPAGQPDADAVS